MLKDSITKILSKNFGEGTSLNSKYLLVNDQ